MVRHRRRRRLNPWRLPRPDLATAMAVPGAVPLTCPAILSGVCRGPLVDCRTFGASSIDVTDVGNGQTYPATVVGYDRAHDLAVLQLAGASGLPTATIGDSDTVAISDPVAAIGNAGGRGGTPSIVAGWSRPSTRRWLSAMT